MELLILLVVIVVLMLIGVPLFAAIAGGCVAYFLATPGLSLNMIPTYLVKSMDSFTFLAIPFFITAGQIMNRGGITEKIHKFADTLVGRFPGGLGYTNIVGSFIFAGMSGSALADLGGLGVVEMKSMKEAGYDDDFTMGVTLASATIGPIVPPSLPMVTYALFANVSVGALFMAGFAPGFVMVITMSIMTYFYAKKRNYPVSKKYSFKEILSAFYESVWALLSPVILICSIWTGLVTPTEAAFLCVVYSILVGMFVYKDLHLRDVPRILLESFKAMLPCLTICVSCVLLAFIMNYSGVSKILYSWLSQITTNKYVFLVMVNILLFVVGMILDTSASMPVLVPILAPIALRYGINPIHFGVIVCLNLMIGLSTPPVGMCLYLIKNITKKSLKEVSLAVLPWLIPLIISLIVVTFWEGYVMFIPSLFGIG